MARAALRAVGHDDRLSLVEHLDELRSRLIICLGAFLVCFAVCFWQNGAILDIMNRPLEKTAFRAGSNDPFERSAEFQQQEKKFFRDAEAFSKIIGSDKNVSAGTRAAAEQFGRTAKATRAAVPPKSAKRPVTLGVGEPFTATFKVASYAALLLALPILLFQAYAFILPAFSPRERSVAMPLLLMVPFLFIAGVAFAYYMILPPAISFLQNFNDDNYDILLQAKDYYSFEIMVLISMGGVFQVPVGILAAVRMGIVTPKQLRQWRRYAIVLIAVIAMVLPGQDPVTMLLIMLPLIGLYEGSILLSTLLDRRMRRARAREEAEMAAANDAELIPLDPDDD
jgi:sec-independent protein translocase protein TatC